MASIKVDGEASKGAAHEREANRVRAEFGCIPERSARLAPPVAAAEHCGALGCRQCATPVHGNGNGHLYSF